MPDIVLAAYAGQAWLVRGEQYIDDLLNNTLPSDVSTGVVTCESKSAVDALWYEWNEADVTAMWLIHPAIVRRTQLRSGQAGTTVVAFAPWSAALDEAARRAVADAAAAAQPGTVAVLVHHRAADAPPMMAGLADLRCGLLEQHLAEHGLTRTAREAKEASDPAQLDQIHLVLRQGE